MVIAVIFLLSLGADILSFSITKEEDYYARSPWILPVVLMVSSAVLYYTVRQLKKNIAHPMHSNVLDAIEKPRPAYRKQIHSFLLIPLEYWPFILTGVALLVLLHNYR